MRPTERRQEVVQRYFVGKVRDLDGGCVPPRSFPVKEVIRADAEIEKMARLYTIGIVVVILRARERSVPALWKREEFRGDQALFATRAGTVCEWVVDCGECSITGQADCHLLIRRKNAQRRTGIGDTAHDQAAVIAICQNYPLRVVGPLIAEI